MGIAEDMNKLESMGWWIYPNFKDEFLFEPIGLEGQNTFPKSASLESAIKACFDWIEKNGSKHDNPEPADTEQEAEDKDSNNADRADRVAQLIELGHSAKLYDEEDPETVITDMVTDFMHFCALQKIDFKLIVSMSEGHFDAENDT